jgi:hypothetical protein
MANRPLGPGPSRSMGKRRREWADEKAAGRVGDSYSILRTLVVCERNRLIGRGRQP